MKKMNLTVFFLSKKGDVKSTRIYRSIIAAFLQCWLVLSLR